VDVGTGMGVSGLVVGGGVVVIDSVGGQEMGGDGVGGVLVIQWLHTHDPSLGC
jgi:hypothetical protein